MTRTLEQLDTAVARIEAALGDLTKTIDQWRAGPNPPETPGKFYPVFKSLQQLYDSQNTIVEEFKKLKAGAPSSPSPVVTPTPAPAPTTGTLSQASRDEVIKALRDNTDGIAWVITNVESIAASLKANIYPIGDPDVIATVSYIMFGPALNTPDYDVIERYRRIVDPRDSDASPAPNPSTTPAPSTPGTSWPTLQADNIQFRANTRRLPTQNGITGEYCGELRMNGYDGGLRTAQNYKDNDFSKPVVPELPAGVHGCDAKASWSYAQFPKATDAPGVPAEDLEGQSVVMDGGFGQQGYHFATGLPMPRGFLFSAQRRNQSMYFAAGNGRTPGAYAMNRVAFYVDGATPLGGNPFMVFADGMYRRVKTATINGVPVLSY